ncbi:V-set and transmembrane domain-containing protein 5 [Poecilia latipinna]|uniref:V-set and transmembrane domain containing 5 n=1 Tax=Poecilia latipinna TaxID=48699 RepID=A0A3B3TRM8_9TELE|nr:PREDICTED: V-set and transmembrane domain-containing protein 5 [Poecilia latipinna]XP_014893892.1 PREDICTED: V-set and transmembrane domain-containing protein 5 [Poecilia latipinna]
MLLFRLWEVHDVALFLSITLYLCHSARSISVSSSKRNLIRSVQDDVFFSVDVTSSGVPTIRWSFMSGAVSRPIGAWQPGGITNITQDYSDRVKACDNGSMLLSDLKLQDAGYYVVTAEDSAGNSRDLGFVLKVNEVLYEDLQYLSVTALALMVVAALLALAMWLLHKGCRKLGAWRRQLRMPANDATELQPL